MGLTLHLSVHVLTAFVAGYMVWRIWRKPLVSFGAAFFGAVLIDLDHLVDYFFAFGLHFDLASFLQGAQFDKNEKIYVLLHGWEYVILLLILAWLIRKNIQLKVGILAFALGAFFHLVLDTNINQGMSVKGYSILYRSVQGFEMEQVVTAEHYQKVIKKQ